MKHFIFKCLLLHVLFNVRDYTVVLFLSLLEGYYVLVTRERNIQKKIISTKSILTVGRVVCWWWVISLMSAIFKNISQLRNNISIWVLSRGFIKFERPDFTHKCITLCRKVKITTGKGKKLIVVMDLYHQNPYQNRIRQRRSVWNLNFRCYNAFHFDSHEWMNELA